MNAIINVLALIGALWVLSLLGFAVLFAIARLREWRDERERAWHYHRLELETKPRNPMAHKRRT